MKNTLAYSVAYKLYCSLGYLLFSWLVVNDVPSQWCKLRIACDTFMVGDFFHTGMSRNSHGQGEWGKSDSPVVIASEWRRRRLRRVDQSSYPRSSPMPVKRRGKNCSISDSSKNSVEREADTKNREERKNKEQQEEWRSVFISLWVASSCINDERLIFERLAWACKSLVHFRYTESSDSIYDFNRKKC